MSTEQSFLDKLYKDKNGKFALIEKPNIPLAGWIVCKLLGLLPLSSELIGVISFTGTALLFTWAYLEITSGRTYLRRVLGAVIIIAIIMSHQ